MQTTAQKISLPKRFAPVLFAFIMSASLGGAMSAVITGINTGFGVGFVDRWLPAYALAFSLAFPSVTFLAPIVRRLVDRLTD